MIIEATWYPELEHQPVKIKYHMDFKLYIPYKICKACWILLEYLNQTEYIKFVHPADAVP